MHTDFTDPKSKHEPSASKEHYILKVDRSQGLRSRFIDSHLQGILGKGDDKELKRKKLDCVKKLYDMCIDVRIWNYIRHTLNNLHLGQQTETVDMSTFKYVFGKGFKTESEREAVLEMLLQIVQENETAVSVVKFCNFVDYVCFFPLEVKRDKNKSEDIFYILSQNQTGSVSYATEKRDED